MDALGIVYPQFWMQLDVDFSFSLHLTIIKKHCCETKKVKPSLLQVAKPLNFDLLNLQMCMFKFTMKTQAPKAIIEPFDVNPMTTLWVTINTNALFIQQLNDYLKLVEIIVVSMLYEYTFSMFTFMKDKLCNRLGLHLDTTVHMFAQKFYIQHTIRILGFSDYAH